MNLLNRVVLTHCICISWNAFFVKGEINTSNHCNQNSADYHIEIKQYIPKILKNSFLKEFNLVMQSKNEKIQSLKEQIIEKDKILLGIWANLNPKNTSTSQSTTTTSNVSNFKRFGGLTLNYFLRKRLLNTFKKEVSDIINEKEQQIYLLEELLREKENTIELQQQLRAKKTVTKLKAETKRIMGMGEPSFDETELKAETKRIIGMGEPSFDESELETETEKIMGIGEPSFEV